MAYSAEIIESENLNAAEDNAAHPTQKPVDLVHLCRQTFGNKELEAEVLGLFLSHSVQCLARLQAATTDKDWADAAHSIKGTARAIGAWKVGDITETYERLAEQNKLQDKAPAVVEIAAVINETNEYIRDLMRAA
ncbi:MAG: hypothetical protein DHS20C08_02140 [Rhodomicrobium sp.]|nr:MAG: hypothetical protein DHS20C08_02140 [Rhodomicrobium sp.]